MSPALADGKPFPVQRTTMTRYSRKPAAITLILTLAAGLSAFAATGQFRNKGEGGATIDQLERELASGKTDVGTWTAYGDALRGQKQFAHAAAAYQRALEMHPSVDDLQKLRFTTALCLGQAGDADKFFVFFTHLTLTDPKLAVDLLERPELATLRQDSRWGPASASARSQASD
jgi:tetratricopeptide (TPR) repeat protein